MLAVNAIIVILSVCSMLACMIVMIIATRLPILRGKSFAETALYIAASDLITGYTVGLYNPEDSIAFKYQSFSVMFGLCSVFWSVILVHIIFQKVVLEYRNVKIKRMHHYFCWGWPFLFAADPTFYHIIRPI